MKIFHAVSMDIRAFCTDDDEFVHNLVNCYDYIDLLLSGNHIFLLVYN